MSRRSGTVPTRWIDLGISWFRQYSIAVSPEAQPDLHMDQIGGYLDATSLAFLPLDADLPADLPLGGHLRAVHEQITRAEAEFCGRLLMDGSDLGRWFDDPQGLTWAVLCLTRPLLNVTQADLAPLCQRGVRIFAPGAGADLRMQLELLTRIGQCEGRSIGLDMAPLGAQELISVLERIELGDGPSGPLLPLIRDLPAADVASLPDETLSRIKRTGGVIGVSLRQASSNEIRATLERSVSLRGADGACSLAALASGLLTSLPVETEFNSAKRIIDTVTAWFGPGPAQALLHSNAQRFLERLIGPVIRPSAVPQEAQGPTGRTREERPAY